MYDKYIIRKGKTDLISSLNAMNKDILKEEMEFNDVETLDELKNAIIDKFRDCLVFSKSDIFTQLFFKRILEFEDTNEIVPLKEDIRALWAFVYKKEKNFSYYIPDEIKEIIKKEFKW